MAIEQPVSSLLSLHWRKSLKAVQLGRPLGVDSTLPHNPGIGSNMDGGFLRIRASLRGLLVHTLPEATELTLAPRAGRRIKAQAPPFRASVPAGYANLKFSAQSRCALRQKRFTETRFGRLFVARL
jgi:hypothetical protein